MAPPLALSSKSLVSLITVNIADKQRVGGIHLVCRDAKEADIVDGQLAGERRAVIGFL